MQSCGILSSLRRIPGATSRKHQQSMNSVEKSTPVVASATGSRLQLHLHSPISEQVLLQYPFPCTMDLLPQVVGLYNATWENEKPISQQELPQQLGGSTT